MPSIATNINCGYARVAMKELSEEDFRKYFQSSLCIDEEYFLQRHGKKSPSKYLENLKQIAKCF